jgi:uncharacterized surface protein with fasciclin (FAS1) repeats
MFVLVSAASTRILNSTPAENGMLHVIDVVLVPPTEQEAPATAPVTPTEG